MSEELLFRMLKNSTGARKTPGSSNEFLLGTFKPKNPRKTPGSSKELLLGIFKPSFNPHDIPGNNVKLWLDGADTLTITETIDKVSQWDDKSGNANHVVQAIGVNQPTTNATTQNGKNVIDWDGGDGLELPSGLYSIPNASYTMFVVSKRNTETAGLETLLSMNDGLSTEVFFTYSNVVNTILYRNGTGGVVSSIGNVNTDFQIIKTRRDGTTNALSVNGDTEDTNTNATNVPGIDSAEIGNVPTGVNLIGSIAEIIIYNRSLSTSETTLIEAYLSTKWGVTLDDGAFKPIDIAGNSLWLDADDEDTITRDGSDLVSQWDDKSGNSKNAVQGTSINQPQYHTNVLNSKPILRGNTTSRTMGISPAVTYGTATSIFIVASRSTVNAYIFSDLGAPAGAPAFLSAIDGKSFEFFGESPRFTFSASATGHNLLELIHTDGGNTKGYFNGASVYDQAAGLTMNTGEFDKIFSTFDGDIAEVIIYNQALSDADRETVEAYLSSKWGLP